MNETCIVCGDRAVQLHHACYAQHVRRLGGNLNDPRNLVPICKRCHERHHQRVRTIPPSLLPDHVLDFAVDLMGADATYEWARRYYPGPDPRVDSLLPEQRRAA